MTGNSTGNGYSRRSHPSSRNYPTRLRLKTSDSGKLVLGLENIRTQQTRLAESILYVNEEAWDSATHQKTVFQRTLRQLAKAREGTGTSEGSSGSYDVSTGSSSLSSESRRKNDADISDFIMDDDND
ncbi:hypothetical protein V8E36_001055 [Tilletia maclaganii]